MTTPNDEIVDLDSRRGVWTDGFAVCLDCGYRWIGVMHVEARFLECPECHAMRGIAVLRRDEFAAMMREP